MRLLKQLLSNGIALLVSLSASVNATPNFEQLFTNIPKLYGEQANDTVFAWKALIVDSAAKDKPEQIKIVNEFFNKNIQVATDKSVWLQEDYWASPLETMMQRKGDSEDFVIAKYCTLVNLGFPPASLRLVYVSQRLSAIRSLPHMVLAYYADIDKEPVILDNQENRVMAASQRSELIPIFSFNSEGYWLENMTANTKTQSDSNYSLWQQVLLKIKAEGVCT